MGIFHLTLTFVYAPDYLSYQGQSVKDNTTISQATKVLLDDFVAIGWCRDGSRNYGRDPTGITVATKKLLSFQKLIRSEALLAANVLWITVSCSTMNIFRQVVSAAFPSFSGNWRSAFSNSFSIEDCNWRTEGERSFQFEKCCRTTDTIRPYSHWYSISFGMPRVKHNVKTAHVLKNPRADAGAKLQDCASSSQSVKSFVKH